MLQELRNRVAEMEQAVLVARGVQARAEEDAADAVAGAFQAEGWLMEARAQLELADEAGLEESIVGLERQVEDLRGRLTPKALDEYDNGGD